MKAEFRARRHRGWRGQSMLEFALILPFMLALFACLMELGRYTLAKQRTRNVVREAARNAMRYDAGGTNFPNTLRLAGVTAQPYNITNDGRFYVGQVMRLAAGSPPTIIQYGELGNLADAPAKVLGGGLNGVATLPANVILETNQVMYVAESYFRFGPVLPFAWETFSFVVRVPETNKVYDVVYF